MRNLSEIYFLTVAIYSRAKMYFIKNVDTMYFTMTHLDHEAERHTPG